MDNTDTIYYVIGAVSAFITLIAWCFKVPTWIWSRLSARRDRGEGKPRVYLQKAFRRANPDLDFSVPEEYRDQLDCLGSGDIIDASWADSANASAAVQNMIEEVRSKAHQVPAVPPVEIALEFEAAKKILEETKEGQGVAMPVSLTLDTTAWDAYAKRCHLRQWVADISRRTGIPVDEITSSCTYAEVREMAAEVFELQQESNVNHKPGEYDR